MAQVFQEPTEHASTSYSLDSYKEYFIEIITPKTADPYEKIQLEKIAYQSQRENLMKEPKLIGKFVAFHDSNLIDSDVDQNILLERVYKKFGYIPILIEKLGEELEFTVHSPQYKTT